MYDHYPSLRGCVRDCCRRFIERWRKSASYRSEPAEEKSGKKHLISLSLFLLFSSSLFQLICLYLSLSTSVFSSSSCISTYPAYEPPTFLTNRVFLSRSRQLIPSCPRVFTTTAVCSWIFVISFLFFPCCRIFYLSRLFAYLAPSLFSPLRFSFSPPSLSPSPLFSLFLYFYLSLSLRLSLSFLAVNCVYLPTRVSQYFLVRESETNDGPQATIKILMFYFFLFYRLSQSTKLHPRVLITSIAKTQRGKFSRVSSLLACTPTWCMP